MSKEGTIGTATFLALAAVLGVSLQGGSKPAESGGHEQTDGLRQKKTALARQNVHKERPGCSAVGEAVVDFLAIKDLHFPSQCYEPSDVPQDQPSADLAEKSSRLRFVVALLPDPVHTHSSALFDQFAAAIQEASQDEEYEFDSSWMPWDADESSYPLLDDEKRASRERDWRQVQPGIILFRKNCSDKKSCHGDPSGSYREGLFVLVVGEDATHGIQREQFSNALDWITAIQPSPVDGSRRIGILGPTFSGSFPSLEQLLKDPAVTEKLALGQSRTQPLFAIYSGSVTSNEGAQVFQDLFRDTVKFHSFVQADEEVLARFCDYMIAEQSGFNPKRIAIISEDETAYGGDLRDDGDGESQEKTTPDRTDCEREALKLYYPRDISALRGAYQTKSLFDIGTSSSSDAQKRNLPTDLADQTKARDSIRDYGANQTPLAQEAFLMQIVSALRELHASYIILRSSNTLDQLFLANFFRRSFPDGRIVINGSDLMFIRERGSTGLSGAMTLSTYPLFPLERDWTEHQVRPAADRTFSADTAEGTYVAFRLLVNARSLVDKDWNSAQCHVAEDVADQAKIPSPIFVPPVSCAKDPPIPDYSPPFWTLEEQCGELPTNNAAHVANQGDRCLYPGPATWLSAIGVNRFWPMASLTHETPRRAVHQSNVEHAHIREADPVGLPVMPLGMKIFLMALMGASVFHAWCCGSGSYTAKPVFRAHFASTGDVYHKLLIFGGSCCIGFLSIIAGWGCGVFSRPLKGLSYPAFALACVLFVWIMAGVALLAYGRNSWQLSQDLPAPPPDCGSRGPWKLMRQCLTTDNYETVVHYLIATFLFCLVFMVPLWFSRLVENSVLTQWRAMHLSSGVSPLVPFFAIMIGLYLSFWFTLHGLALFGPDRPRLPRRMQLALKINDRQKRHFLRMFSQDIAAHQIERAAVPLSWTAFKIGSAIFVSFCLVAWIMAQGVPVRSLGSQNFSILFLIGLNLCCTMSIVEAVRLYRLWAELRRLLEFLDRLPIRRTLASLRGFSWGGVWKMSGNVLEVRYKVISRQMECMNHTIATLENDIKAHDSDSNLKVSLEALYAMRVAGTEFAKWYSSHYLRIRAGNLSTFQKFQQQVASASGVLFSQLLVPAWRLEPDSLLVGFSKDEKDRKDDPGAGAPLAIDKHLRNAEEFVCLNYLSFIQNVLGRLRTMAMTIIALFVTSACAMSSYPFDPRQALSAVLIALFVVGGVVIVKVYADMHRDATLSHVTNTRPGELGMEFWLKIAGFGFAPLLGLLTRIFPGATDFLFAWIQPGISSLK
jgi:hypothetical protein